MMSIERFMEFMKNVKEGQPLHRDDLGDEASASQSVLGGMSPAVVQLAPQLQKQLTRNLAPTAAPKAAPPSMGMGMGGGGGGPISGGGRGASRPPQSPPPRDDQD